MRAERPQKVEAGGYVRPAGPTREAGGIAGGAAILGYAIGIGDPAGGLAEPAVLLLRSSPTPDVLSPPDQSPLPFLRALPGL